MGKVWSKIQTINLTYGEWETIKLTVHAKVFGEMVKLAHMVRFYQSDLYHDALFIREMVKGEMQFDWIARESGTFIGNVAQYIKDDDWPGMIRYRFEIWKDEERDKWLLNIYQAV